MKQHDSAGHGGKDHHEPNKFLKQIIDKLNGQWDHDRAEIGARYRTITQLDVRICILVKHEYKNWEIARALDLSEKTVDNHRYLIRKKLRLKTEENLGTFLSSEIKNKIV